MNYTLFDLFLNAYNGNSFAQLQIVQRFQPLLKKYAALLKYEDAYSDLQLYLLELLHSGKLTKLQRKDDGTLVKYIESSIRHQYISLNSRKNAVDNSVIASVDEIDFDQMSLSSNDEYPELLISDLHSVLQKNQAITEKKGLERMKPEELYPYIEKNQPNICQISVLQNGQEP
mgnify:CR=1 FL=1